jgi:uncharacterized delta-60 repeat protein
MKRRDRHRYGRLLTALVAAASALAAITAVAFAGAGGLLDDSFSGDGKRKLEPHADLAPGGVAIDGQGRILVTGPARFSGGSLQLSVARFMPSGQLDPSFSGDGRRAVSFPGTLSSFGADVKIDAAGRIVVGGSTYDGFNQAWAAARLMPDGSLDRSFSSDGKRVIKFGSANPSASALAIDGQGRIVIAGTSEPDAAFVRLLPDGSLDHSFGGDGKRTVTLGPGSDSANDVAVAGGKIYAAASKSSNQFAAMRLLSNGNPDPSFSGDGRRAFDFSGSFSFAGGVAVQDDGRAVVAGGNSGIPSTMAIVRFRRNGSLDPSFAGDGKRFVTMANGVEAADVGLQPNGQIVTAGFVSAPGGQSFAIARLLRGGALDDSFSGDGKRAVSFPGFAAARAFRLALGGGRVTVVGEAPNGSESSLHEVWAIARLLTG